ncbi:NAD+ synthase [Campylobacter sp. TTU-622]|uniref:NAD+ synthase n=1 Tax=unclassified Campylobacter TaxID=2593542 RepID=UPI0019069E0F|nr:MULTISPECIES: NAD+ synthase [unclassified Campylobacter]MBK1971825.1 NAD+ synthase [Campylobacter sp. TTU_617]MBK1972706.1 NAD+ synthase [Campylobacter sp. TTU-622]MBK1991928.1 NAD+ synthase [Campylobacter sp. 2018MI34]
MDYEKLTQKIYEFIKERIKNANAKGVVLGLSGGIDSALVATLCKNALKTNIFALLMPSKYSNEQNLQDALKLCKDLDIEYKIIKIDKILTSFLEQSQDINKIRMGNLCARIRMSLLYDYSALKECLVAGTSNKSELMLGYGTIYGDLACAFNPIGNFYKSEIYNLATFLNLDQVFIQKAPSADLWVGQNDQEDLGFSYEEIDQGLKALELNDKEKILSLNPELVSMLKERMTKYAFKRALPEIFNDLA